MPQGSRLGPLSFIVLIVYLMAGATVDDTTHSESLSFTSQVSNIDSHIKCLLSWTIQNSMKINYFKTKEMLLGPLSKHSIPPLVIDYNPIERVCGFKLFGVYISNDLSWNQQVDYICDRANDRLHYLKRYLGVLVFLYWTTCHLISFRHYTSSWILRSSLAPRLEEISDRSDWDDPHTSYSHYLSSENVYTCLLYTSDAADE